MENSTAQEFMEDILSTISITPQPIAANAFQDLEILTIQENQIEKWLEDVAYEQGFRWVAKNGYRSIDNRQNVSFLFLLLNCYVTSQ